MMIIAKFIFSLVFICFSCFCANSQSTKRFGIIQYSESKNWSADESDPLMKVYVVQVTDSVFFGAVIWATEKGKGNANEDYSYYINILKEMYNIGTNYTREPQINNFKNGKYKAQFANCTGADILDNTKQIAIALKVFSTKNKKAAVHFYSNDIDRCKKQMNDFFKLIIIK